MLQNERQYVKYFLGIPAIFLKKIRFIKQLSDRQGWWVHPPPVRHFFWHLLTSMITFKFSSEFGPGNARARGWISRACRSALLATHKTKHIVCQAKICTRYGVYDIPHSPPAAKGEIQVLLPRPSFSRAGLRIKKVASSRFSFAAATGWQGPPLQGGNACPS